MNSAKCPSPSSDCRGFYCSSCVACGGCDQQSNNGGQCVAQLLRGDWKLYVFPAVLFCHKPQFLLQMLQHLQTAHQGKTVWMGLQVKVIGINSASNLTFIYIKKTCKHKMQKKKKMGWTPCLNFTAIRGSIREISSHLLSWWQLVSPDKKRGKVQNRDSDKIATGVLAFLLLHLEMYSSFSPAIPKCSAESSMANKEEAECGVGISDGNMLTPEWEIHVPPKNRSSTTEKSGF